MSETVSELVSETVNQNTLTHALLELLTRKILVLVTEWQKEEEEEDICD